jgi:hypothetical protein
MPDAVVLYRSPWSANDVVGIVRIALEIPDLPEASAVQRVPNVPCRHVVAIRRIENQ